MTAYATIVQMQHRNDRVAQGQYAASPESYPPFRSIGRDLGKIQELRLK
jgi:hypothetical protein